ncbi:hypothetical protein VR46_27820 [Streptomyces sp. NRRL S-444]|nr:hypothetical protein VR46_27820 [Streptomyces sp. NRRL S-444]
MRAFCGIDWASDHHDIAVVDESGSLLDRARIDDTAEGLNQLLRMLAEHGDSPQASSAVPLLLLAGDRDPRLPAIRETADRICSATLAELPGCGHLDTFLRTDLTLPVVRAFLTGQKAP